MTGSSSARAPACSSSRSWSTREAARRADLRGNRRLRHVVRRVHMTAPSEDGDGARRAMAMAIREGRTSRRTDVDYINAHGTSTPYNDRIETRAIHNCFGDHAGKLAISSTKSMTGHLLGGAGGLEAGITALAVPPAGGTADDQPRRSGSGLRSGLRSAPEAGKCRSATRCRTPSASAERTRRFCSRNSTSDRLNHRDSGWLVS